MYNYNQRLTTDINDQSEYILFKEMLVFLLVIILKDSVTLVTYFITFYLYFLAKFKNKMTLKSTKNLKKFI